MSSPPASTYDVVVVGAGPAGASAAGEAARRKMRVLMVDKRSVVGIPVQCAEYIPRQLIGELNCSKAYIIQRVRGMRTFCGDRLLKESLTPGVMIDRARLDQLLVEAACNDGAELLLSAKVSDRHDDTVTIKPRGKSPFSVQAKVIIGADGPFSTVGKWIDSVNESPMPAVQIQVPLLEQVEFTHVYFDPEIFGGYAWFFPRGNRANVGLGMRQKAGSPAPLTNLLDRLLSRLAADQHIELKPLERISGWIPCALLAKTVDGNIMLTGDAAGHTHPITGAGIFPAITAGKMAGKWAARAVTEENIALLSQYQTEYEDLFGSSMNRAAARRRLMESQWDRLSEILPNCWVAFKEYYAGT